MWFISDDHKKTLNSSKMRISRYSRLPFYYKLFIRSGFIEEADHKKSLGGRWRRRRF